eukprot:6339285-Prymnesium_polylepis.1
MGRRPAAAAPGAAVGAHQAPPRLEQRAAPRRRLRLAGADASRLWLRVAPPHAAAARRVAPR